MTESSGWLASIDRDADDQYDDYRDCLWTIIVPEDMLVEVQFLLIDFIDDSRDYGTYNFIDLFDDVHPPQIVCDVESVKMPSFRSNTSPNHCGRHLGKINGHNSTYVKVWRCTFGRITRVLMKKS